MRRRILAIHGGAKRTGRRRALPADRTGPARRRRRRQQSSSLTLFRGGHIPKWSRCFVPGRNGAPTPADRGRRWTVVDGAPSMDDDDTAVVDATTGESATTWESATVGVGGFHRSELVPHHSLQSGRPELGVTGAVGPGAAGEPRPPGPAPACVGGLRSRPRRCWPGAAQVPSGHPPTRGTATPSPRPSPGSHRSDPTTPASSQDRLDQLSTGHDSTTRSSPSRREE
jgi:hypothetical protein